MALCTEPEGTALDLLDKALSLVEVSLLFGILIVAVMHPPCSCY
jgi:hypothetical protein